MSYNDLRDFAPEFIAEDFFTGDRIEIEKLGGGAVGKKYSETWRFMVTDFGDPVMGVPSITHKGQDLVTPVPCTHEDAAEFAAEYFGLDWEAFEPVRGKYVLIPETCYAPGPGLPERPGLRNTVSSLKEAEEWFRNWIRNSGHDYVMSDGESPATLWIYLLDAFDGISYGDPVGAWTRGPRGGIVRESI